MTAPASAATSRRVVVPTLGVTQILAWGATYYLPAVLAQPIAADTGWPLGWVVGGLSVGLGTAAVVSARAGDAIARFGGRPVLAASAVLIALGLVLLGLAPVLPVYLAGWVVIGLGMGSGLYDAAFGTLGRLYGQDARSAITSLTLFGGFASTVSWPLSAYFVAELGWRGACLAYAAIHLAVVLPLYLCALPREPGRAPVKPMRSAGAAADAEARGERGLLVLITVVVTVNAAIAALVAVHLLTFLQDRGIALAGAVALGAAVGPAQVGARAVEMMVGRLHHPVWTQVAAALLVALGLAMLWSGLPLVVAALLAYGGGMGLTSIARATLPLALFGEARYPGIMGRIAVPSLAAQAASPTLGALLIDHVGSGGALAGIAAAGAVNLVLSVVLLVAVHLPRR